jgi:hypothetical protein
MLARRLIRSRFSEPQDCAVFGFFSRNEPVVASGGLKCLKLLHNFSSLCSLPREGHVAKHAYE